MKISLIIAYYKNLAALSLILKSLAEQSFKNFEVIIAEDDNEVESFKFIDKRKKEVDFILKHVRQEFDKGFRKNQMLNKAIKNSEGEIIVFFGWRFYST